MKLKTLLSLGSLFLASTLTHFGENTEGKEDTEATEPTYGEFKLVIQNKTPSPIYLDADKKTKIKAGQELVESLTYMQLRILAKSYLKKWINTQSDPDSIESYPKAFSLVTPRHYVDIEIDFPCSSDIKGCDFDSIQNPNVLNPESCQLKCNGSIIRSYRAKN